MKTIEAVTEILIDIYNVYENCSIKGIKVKILHNTLRKKVRIVPVTWKYGYKSGTLVFERDLIVFI